LLHEVNRLTIRIITKPTTAKKIKEVMVSVVFLFTSPSIPPTDKPPNLAGLLEY
jgi:hypothetical protein